MMSFMFSTGTALGAAVLGTGGYLGYRCTGAYSKAGLVGIDYTATGYD
jgi:hypothetical protein